MALENVSSHFDELNKLDDEINRVRDRPYFIRNKDILSHFLISDLQQLLQLKKSLNAE